MGIWDLKKCDRGSTSVLFAISLPVIIGAIALMTEAGYWNFKKSDLQNAADMAAMAGGYEYMITTSKPDAALAATIDAKENSFDFTKGTITVNIPPTSGNYNGEDAVEVIISQSLPTFFSQLVYKEGVTANVRAIASLGGQTAENCVLSVGNSGTGISVGGNVNVNLNGCGLHANSTGSNAITTFGNVTIEAACLSTTGGTSIGNNSNISLDECSAPRTNQPAIADPYASVVVNSNHKTAPCQSVSTTGKGKNQSIHFPNPNGGVVRFCNNSINLKGTVNLQPGVYVFDGTDVDFGSHAQLIGDGVTLIFRNDAMLRGINGNNRIQLTPPTSGEYSGLVILGDDSLSNGNWDFNGNASISITGAVYLPTIDIDYGGGAGSDLTECTQIIGRTVSFIGNSGIQNNCEGWGTAEITGGAYTTIALVE